MWSWGIPRHDLLGKGLSACVILWANQIQVRPLVGNSSNTTRRRASAPFIGALRFRDGKTVLWREFQNVLAIAQVLGQLPALITSLGTAPAHPPPCFR